MATKNIVPRANGEGGIGTSAKRWLNAFFQNLNGLAVSSTGAATETASGLVELSTIEEAVAGADALRAVTPAGLSAVATIWKGPVASTYSTVSTFLVSTDDAANLTAGMRIKADCGTDGTKYGILSGIAGQTITLTMDTGHTLTANLVRVWYSTRIPNSADVGAIPISAKGVAGGVAPLGLDDKVPSANLPTPTSNVPGIFARDIRFAAKTVSVAADRLIILSPNRMLVDVNGTYLVLTAQQVLNLSLAATWDSVTTDYTVASARAGKNFYVYACINAGSLKLLVSANATYPSGFDATTSRKIGGFHCLCKAVGTISGHTLSGYLAGDILPASVWDLKHRPVCAPEGMVYVDGLGKWVDIYLASVSGGKLVSAYNATCADGTSSPAFHWYKFSQWLGQIGKRMLTQTEFVAASLGSNQGTNITGSADPGTTGGKSDTAGRRMISNVGCEDCCGNLWQWGEEAGGGASSAAWVNAFDGNDSGVAGHHYQAPNRAILGGSWDNGANCGSRGSAWAGGPLSLNANCGARGVAEPLAA